MTTEVFAVRSVTDNLCERVCVVLLRRLGGGGHTLFEQDWQSLMCPDGADGEVRRPYIFQLKMAREGGRVSGRDGSI